MNAHDWSIHACSCTQQLQVGKCLVATPVKAAYKSPGKVIFILTFLHCIQKTKLRFFAHHCLKLVCWRLVTFPKLERWGQMKQCAVGSSGWEGS